MNTEHSSPLYAKDLTLGYDKKIVARELSVSIPQGKLTVIIGPNACGKSTLLRTLSRLMPPQSGTVFLDGKLIGDYGTRDVAKRLGLLPQSSTAPGDISVADLVARGRYPHQSLFSRWTAQDTLAVNDAMHATGVFELAESTVNSLSGGQRQRVWIAMVLAQQTPLLLLDEPLGALDALTRIEMQELIVSLWQEHGFTVLLVTHDVSEAVAMADRVLLIEEGKIGLDLTVDLPRPRKLGSVRLAELESQVLERVMKRQVIEEPARVVRTG